jgi:hypothetical protein
MKEVTLPVPMFGFILATRAALAAGVALLVGGRLSPERRRAVGTTLVAIGVATTVPAAMFIRRGFRRGGGSVVHRDKSLIGATRFARKGDDELSG